MFENFENNEIKEVKVCPSPVLPEIYDDSISYYEVLNKVLAKLDEVISQTNDTTERQEELSNKVDEFTADITGQFNDLKNSQESLSKKVDDFTKNITDEFEKVKVSQDETVKKVDEFIDTVTGEIDDLNKTVDNFIDETRKTYEQYQSEINQKIEEINNEWNEYKTEINNMLAQRAQEWEDYKAAMSQEWAQYKQENDEKFETFKNETNAELANLSGDIADVSADVDEFKADTAEKFAGVDAKFDDVNAELSQKVDKSEVVQSTGESTSDIMSQKAVTDELNKKQVAGDYATKAELTAGLGTKQDVGDYATRTELQEGLDTKQNVGDYATRTEVSQKVDKSEVVQSTGESTSDIMSQKAVTDELNKKQVAGDYATKAELTAGLGTKQDVGDYITNEEAQEKFATKQEDAEKLPLAGGTMRGDIKYNVAEGHAPADDVTLIHLESNVKDEFKFTDAFIRTDGDMILGSGSLQDYLRVKPHSRCDIFIASDERVHIVTNASSDGETHDTYMNTDGLIYYAKLRQQTGDDTHTVMSQKAVTDELNKKQNVGDYATKTELQEGLDTKQNVGDYATKTNLNALSSALAETQKQVTSLENDKVDKTSVVQEHGTSTTEIMSQKAITEVIAKIINSIHAIYYSGYINGEIILRTDSASGRKYIDYSFPRGNLDLYQETAFYTHNDLKKTTSFFFVEAGSYSKAQAGDILNISLPAYISVYANDHGVVWFSASSTNFTNIPVCIIDENGMKWLNPNFTANSRLLVGFPES